ncbi:unnamed protein product [Ceutorhynchus assimilis]|uniref:FAS1 domain-containing protein n=1 Tax=Ceutorhynchus assimilis TaxID=467358 RepID=A0A9N9MZF1_9CUCU|nr:unnamed protein product [Ceutorhynchus assimilis]
MRRHLTDVHAGGVDVGYVATKCFFLTVIVTFFGCHVTSGLQTLPDTGGINGQLTANHSVDHFFSLWLVFINDDVKISDKPFTIFAPKNRPSEKVRDRLRNSSDIELFKKLLMDQVILGTKVNLSNLDENKIYSTLGGTNVTIYRDNEGAIRVNNATVLEKEIEIPNGILVIVDSYLFDEDEPAISRNVSAREAPSAIRPLAFRTQKPANIGPSVSNIKSQSNASFVENVMEVLSFLKSRVRVFQHFVSRSNVSGLLKEGEEYTVFVPTDHAFQRWHPIDWGFYPFSVPEFTESVIVNHFVRGRLKQDTIKDGQVVQTLGGREILFRRTPNLTVNGATIVKGDTPVEKGNIMFIGEVLFVSESVVSKLHQQHRDKETPPLLAFPWFGAQFLSHAFLALERDKRFTHITRFLNLADLAPHVSGAGYTFFVPTDTAFEELGLDKMPDNYLSNGEGLQILLNHFVKGRLYDKDLKSGTALVTLGNQTLNVNRTANKVHINEALIVESEVFVYNLGTMFYIDKVLYNTLKVVPIKPLGGDIQTSTKAPSTSTTPSEIEYSTVEDIDSVTGELVEEHEPEVLFGDGTQETDDKSEYTTLGPSQNISSPK